MTMPAKIKEFGWFGAGWAVFKGGTKDTDYYPPLNDMEAQRAWLGGFGAAYAEYPDDEAIRSTLHGDGTGGESLNSLLTKALEGRACLLEQLRAHHASRASHAVH